MGGVKFQNQSPQSPGEIERVEGFACSHRPFQRIDSHRGERIGYQEGRGIA